MLNAKFVYLLFGVTSDHKPERALDFNEERKWEGKETAKKNCR